MPYAKQLGIADENLSMVWKSRMNVQFSEYGICLSLSDSILSAMNKRMTFSKPFYNPTICIVHNDQSYLDMLSQQIYGNNQKYDDSNNSENPDLYGLNWNFECSDKCAIYYCLSFDGFCNEVIEYYENAFGIRAKNVILYRTTKYANEVKGKDKIFSALLEFTNGNQVYAIRLQDSFESAIHDVYKYDSNALLFYHERYNPIFNITDHDTEYLSECFQNLSKGGKLNKLIDFSDKTKLCGSLIDKYGICWNFAYEDKQ